MYKIVGADAREYGPIDEDHVKQWIREGRANSFTRVLVEGSPDWTTLGALPQFAAELAAQSGLSGSQVGGTGSSIDGVVTAVLQRNPSFSVGSCLSRGWALVMENFWLSVGATAVVILLVWASSFLPILGPLLLTYVLLGGLDWLLLKLARGQSAELVDVFIGFGPLFVALMLFSLVGQLLTLIGFLLCIIPGIYLMVIWLIFPPLLILDKGMDFWPAMEMSRRVCNRHFWPLLGLTIVVLLMLLVGLLLFVIPFFIVMPIVTAAYVYAYEDLFGAHIPEGAEPATL